MIKIELGDGHFFESDRECFKLVKKTIQQTGKYMGKEKTEILGYYGHLDAAMSSIPEKLVRDEDIGDFKTLYDRLEHHKGSMARVSDAVLAAIEAQQGMVNSLVIAKGEGPPSFQEQAETDE